MVKLPKNNSFFLFGARGTGKTSLINKEFPKSLGVLFIDLLDENQLEKYSLSPQLLKKEIDALVIKPEWVVIDEVQRVPKLLNIAHQLIESKDKIKFILTGSSSRKLKQKGVNLLAGRAWIRNIYPLSVLEIENFFNLSDMLNWGSLPQIFKYKDTASKSDYLNAYALTYIRTEIQAEQWVRKLEPFRKFLPIAAQMNGKVLNYSAISRDVGVEVVTIQSYYKILDETLLGFHLPSYHKAIRKQQRLASKFYFFDLGVKKSLQKMLSVQLTPQTSEWGFAFEHFIICEFIKLNDYYAKDFQFYYLQTKDYLEVDLIIDRPGKPALFIEIKSATKVHIENFGAFLKIANDAKAEAYVISNDDSSRNENDIKFRPWLQALKEIFEVGI